MSTETTKKRRNKKKNYEDRYTIRLEPSLRWQFDQMAGILGITSAELARDAVKNRLQAWADAAYRHAVKCAHEIVKEAIGPRLNLNDQVQIDARVEELMAYDFRKEIMACLGLDQLDPIVSCGEFSLSTTIGNRYFANLQNKPQASAKMLADDRAHLVYGMAVSMLAHIRQDLHSYRKLVHTRSKAKLIPDYDKLSGEEQNQPWSLAAFIGEYEAATMITF